MVPGQVDNIFLTPEPRVALILDEAARLAASQSEEGMVAGLNVKKQPDGSVIIPVAMMARVWPLKQRRDGRWGQTIRVIMPFASEEQPWMFEICGSRIPSALTGMDKVSLWVKPMTAEEEMGNESEQFEDSVW